MKPNLLKIQLLDERGQSLGDMTFPTELTWLELISRLPLMQSEVPEHSRPSTGTPTGKGADGKYSPLAHHLAAQTNDHLTCTFQDIETILGFELPPTARGTHARSWWANTTTHVQGRAWLDQGWRTANIDPRNETLEFRRA